MSREMEWGVFGVNDLIFLRHLPCGRVRTWKTPHWGMVDFAKLEQWRAKHTCRTK